MVGGILYALAAAVLAVYAYVSFMSFSGTPELSTAGKLVLLLLACGLMYGGGRLLSSQWDEPFKQRLWRVNWWVWFVLYLFLLADLTVFGRNVGFGLADWNRETLKMYLQYSFNIIPGHMVVDMIVSAWRGSISPTMALVNIFGNIAALMPTAFFLPRLFQKQQYFKTFALTVSAMVACIEITQFATMSGNFDIDDFILNVGGACLMFRLLETEKAQKWVDRFTGEK